MHSYNSSCKITSGKRLNTIFYGGYYVFDVGDAGLKIRENRMDGSYIIYDISHIPTYPMNFADFPYQIIKFRNNIRHFRGKYY